MRCKKGSAAVVVDFDSCLVCKFFLEERWRESENVNGVNRKEVNLSLNGKRELNLFGLRFCLCGVEGYLSDHR